MTAPVIRIDKWLWFSRLFKSRTLASKVCQSGRMRVNDTVIGKSKFSVAEGDVLTFPRGLHIRVIKIIKLGERRGPAAEAVMLYEDLEPPENRKIRLETENADIRTAPVAERERGSGRPTKTERRAIDKLRSEPKHQEIDE